MSITSRDRNSIRTPLLVHSTGWLVKILFSSSTVFLDVWRRLKLEGQHARIVAGWFGLLAIAPLTFAQASGSLDRPVLVRARRLLDVQAGIYRDHPLIEIRDGVIARISYGKETKPKAGLQEISLPEATLLPGLIDLHTHLAWSTSGSSAGQVEACQTLRAGVTTVRNLGADGFGDVVLRDAIAKGAVMGPRIFASGPGIGSPGGACAAAFGESGVVSNVEDARKKAAELLAHGVDQLKVCAGGGVTASAKDSGTIDLPKDQIAAVVQEAKKVDKPVAAHAQGTTAIRNAIAAGVQTIEHGSLIDVETAKQVIRAGAYLVPTLARLTWLESQVPDANKKAVLKERRRIAFDNIRVARQQGVKLAFGSDATVLPHGHNAEELVALVEIGMSPKEALTTATITSAKVLGVKNLGELKPGMSADIIGVSGDPLNDIAQLRNVMFVMKGGMVAHSNDHPLTCGSTH